VNQKFISVYVRGVRCLKFSSLSQASWEFGELSWLNVWIDQRRSGSLVVRRQYRLNTPVPVAGARAVYSVTVIVGRVASHREVRRCSLSACWVGFTTDRLTAIVMSSAAATVVRWRREQSHPSTTPPCTTPPSRRVITSRRRPHRGYADVEHSAKAAHTLIFPARGPDSIFNCAICWPTILTFYIYHSVAR